MKNDKQKVMLIDKNYIVKHMAKDLPGLVGVSGGDEKTDTTTMEGLPGVPYDSEELNDAWKSGWLDGYEKALSDSSEDDPDDDDDECDKDMKKQEKVVVKSKTERKWKKSIHTLVKKLFNGTIMPSLSFSPLYSEVNGISMINISGEIDKRISTDDKLNGKVDIDDITKAVKIAMSADTTCCVLNINTPGGNSIGVQECGDMIQQLCEIKPVFTFCDKLCASAGYWLACCSNGIYVTPSSEIGSVGVVVKLVNMSENLKMNGIDVKFYTGGDLKAMGHSEKPISDDEDKFIQNEVDKQTLKFRTLVKEYRGDIDDENLQGQLFSGEEAVELNIADEIVPDLDTLLEELSTQQ